jgi:hypothetical protein
MGWIQSRFDHAIKRAQISIISDSLKYFKKVNKMIVADVYKRGWDFPASFAINIFNQ